VSGFARRLRARSDSAAGTFDSSSGLHLDDGEIQDATTIATLCVVLLAGKFPAGQGHSADCEQIETLAADYANRASKQNKIAENLFLGLLYGRHQGAKTATPDLGRSGWFTWQHGSFLLSKKG